MQGRVSQVRRSSAQPAFLAAPLSQQCRYGDTVQESASGGCAAVIWGSDEDGSCAAVALAFHLSDTSRRGTASSQNSLNVQRPNAGWCSHFRMQNSPSGCVRRICCSARLWRASNESRRFSKERVRHRTRSCSRRSRMWLLVRGGCEGESRYFWKAGL